MTRSFLVMSLLLVAGCPVPDKPLPADSAAPDSGNYLDPGCGDCDEDGYTNSEGDCDDANREIHPGAAEICDGDDNDCDGDIDEDAAAEYYHDADEDRFGDASDGLVDCWPPTGYVAVAGDCDDTRADVNPGATEACDGVDNDCDSAIDEDC